MTEQEQRIEEVRRAFGESGHPPVYDSFAREESMLPMADGARLRTIVTRPPGSGPFPSILVRSCYPDEEAYYLEIASQYVRRGFAYIVQFCRGTGGSEGVWEPNVNERADGKETVDWLCGQDWAGNTGYWGASYLALTGWLIADILPCKVKTMYLTVYGTFRHVSVYQDGMFRHDVLTAWAMGNAGFPVEADYLKSCLYRPHARVDEALWGRPVEWYRKWVISTDKSDPYWNEGVWRILQEIPARVKVPISMSEGWYDHHLGSGIETYKALSEECRARSEFWIGPWSHWFSVPLEGDEGRDYRCCDLIRAYEWFDRLLVKEEEPAGRVIRYIPRGDCWIESRGFEIPGGTDAEFHLSGDAVAGLVSDPERREPGERGYLYDPGNPVYTHGGESMLQSRNEIGSLLQLEPDYRPDVLSFVSAPLEEDLTVCGVIRVRLYVKSDAEDTAFAVRVMDIKTDGAAYNVRGGITTLGYRNRSESRVSYTPGDTVEIELALWDIAWRFVKGNRIRLDVQSSDFPQYCIHSNTAGVWSEQTECRTATQTVLFGRRHPSRILFPVIDKEA